MANRQSPQPTASSSHPAPPHSDSDSDPDDQVSVGSSDAVVGPSPEPNPYPTRNPAIYSLSFDQDYNYFTVGLDNGFRIFSTDPFYLKSRPCDSVSHGGIELVAIQFRSDYNYLCLVGGGPNPFFDRNKVMILAGDQPKPARDVSFRSPVIKVKLRQDRIVVVTVENIYVFNFADLKLLQMIKTCVNPRGLCEISSSPTPMVVACPGLPEGRVIVYFASKKIKVLKAHDSAISCMAMTRNGVTLASASMKGSSIRIFNTLSKQFLREVATGYERAEIYSIAFSSDAEWLAVSSDNGCVLIFCIDSDSFQLGLQSRFQIPQGLQHFVGFGHQNNTVLIIGMDGSFYRCLFDPAAIGIDMVELEHHNFMDMEFTSEDLD